MADKPIKISLYFSADMQLMKKRTARKILMYGNSVTTTCTLQKKFVGALNSTSRESRKRIIEIIVPSTVLQDCFTIQAALSVAQ